MTITEATKRYEAWLAEQTSVIKADLKLKHQQMAQTPFAFLRATFYRWAQVWPEECPRLADAPPVLAVGDLHVENFGTWRDAEGRLIWGVNDFDEAFRMPYANDLVRLAVSAGLAVQAGHLGITLQTASDAILSGYMSTLKSGGQPFVLAEHHAWMRNTALSDLRDPVAFWNNLAELPVVDSALPLSATESLEHALPQRDLPYRLVHRTAGLGSLGHPRYAALARWDGGSIAREVKALIPSAYPLARGKPPRHAEIFYDAILHRAVRCPDPFLRVQGQWIARRLAPDCARIEIGSISPEQDELRLLEAMGQETANIHLGTRDAVPDIRHHLRKQKRGWLSDAVETMTESVLKDWHSWQKSYKNDD